MKAVPYNSVFKKTYKKPPKKRKRAYKEPKGKLENEPDDFFESIEYSIRRLKRQGYKTMVFPKKKGAKPMSLIEMARIDEDDDVGDSVKITSEPDTIFEGLRRSSEKLKRQGYKVMVLPKKKGAKAKTLLESAGIKDKDEDDDDDSVDSEPKELNDPSFSHPKGDPKIMAMMSTLMKSLEEGGDKVMCFLKDKNARVVSLSEAFHLNSNDVSDDSADEIKIDHEAIAYVENLAKELIKEGYIPRYLPHKKGAANKTLSEIIGYSPNNQTNDIANGNLKKALIKLAKAQQLFKKAKKKIKKAGYKNGSYFKKIKHSEKAAKLAYSAGLKALESLFVYYGVIVGKADKPKSIDDYREGVKQLLPYGLLNQVLPLLSMIYLDLYIRLYCRAAKKVILWEDGIASVKKLIKITKKVLNNTL